MFMSSSEYDLNPHMFSPQGGLIQIEYAHSATNKGSTAIGIRTNDAVILVTEKSRHSSLMVSKSLNKINVIDDHTLCLYSGIVSDANILVDRARSEAQNHKFTYDEPMSIKSIVQAVAALANTYADPDLAESHRLYARPFGVSMIFAGFEATSRSKEKVGEQEEAEGKISIGDEKVRKLVEKVVGQIVEEQGGTRGKADDEKVEQSAEEEMKKKKKAVSSTRLYLLTPASTEEAWSSMAIGAGGATALRELERSYRDDLTVDEAMIMALGILKNVAANRIEPENVEAAFIGRTRGTVVCSHDEIRNYLDKAEGSLLSF